LPGTILAASRLWLETNPKLEDNMGIFSKDIKSMDDLFLHGLQDIYYAEN
jgi:ferritin-like metal-binding protein YciE